MSGCEVEVGGERGMAHLGQDIYTSALARPRHRILLVVDDWTIDLARRRSKITVLNCCQPLTKRWACVCDLSVLSKALETLRSRLHDAEQVVVADNAADDEVECARERDARQKGSWELYGESFPAPSAPTRRNAERSSMFEDPLQQIEYT